MKREVARPERVELPTFWFVATDNVEHLVIPRASCTVCYKASRKASVFEEQSELVRQFGLETALRKVKEDAIPYATKLAVTTNFAVEQVFKKQLEAVVAEPVTLPEKIAACELKINRIRSEIDYASELLRPARLAQASSRLGELRGAKSPDVQFGEEQLAAKKADLAQLVAQHKTLLAQRRSQRVFSKTVCT